MQEIENFTRSLNMYIYEMRNQVQAPKVTNYKAKKWWKRLRVHELREEEKKTMYKSA